MFRFFIKVSIIWGVILYSFLSVILDTVHLKPIVGVLLGLVSGATSVLFIIVETYIIYRKEIKEKN